MPDKETPGYKLYRLWQGGERDRWDDQTYHWQARWEKLATKVVSPNIKSTTDYARLRPNINVATDPIAHAAGYGSFNVSLSQAGKREPEVKLTDSVVSGEYNYKGERQVEQPANAITDEQHQANKDAVEAGKRRLQTTVSTKAAEASREAAKEWNKAAFPVQDLSSMIMTMQPEPPNPVAEAERALLNKFVLRALNDKKTRTTVLRAISDALEDVEDYDIIKDCGFDSMLFTR